MRFMIMLVGIVGVFMTLFIIYGIPFFLKQAHARCEKRWGDLGEVHFIERQGCMIKVGNKWIPDDIIRFDIGGKGIYIGND